jgi:hypothetical protein
MSSSLECTRSSSSDCTVKAMTWSTPALTMPAAATAAAAATGAASDLGTGAAAAGDVVAVGAAAAAACCCGGGGGGCSCFTLPAAAAAAAEPSTSSLCPSCSPSPTPATANSSLSLSAASCCSLTTDLNAARGSWAHRGFDCTRPVLGAPKGSCPCHGFDQFDRFDRPRLLPLPRPLPCCLGLLYVDQVGF